ncbi:MAG: hypothetical protein EA376_08370 [Phycisphaeraceae bacterium]|nr:MAG: hypothetical protein EA376_08370 [Phycisphaeraceae bacterium]
MRNDAAGYNLRVTRDDIITTLQDAMPELRREFSIRGLALFGSIARGDDEPGSDIDVLVEFDEGAMVTLFTLSRLLQRLTKLLGRNVDVIEDHPGLGARFRENISRDLCRVA